MEVSENMYSFNEIKSDDPQVAEAIMAGSKTESHIGDRIGKLGEQGVMSARAARSLTSMLKVTAARDLRRMPECRCRRDPRYRTSEEALRLRIRERAAAFGRAGKHGRFLRYS